MNIRGKEKDIIHIKIGHDAEIGAMDWMSQNAMSECPKENWEAFGDGFIQGACFLASYLKEYGITLECFDEEVKTTSKEHWYSGEIIEKNIDEERLDKDATVWYFSDTYNENPYQVQYDGMQLMRAFKEGYRKAKQE